MQARISLFSFSLAVPDPYSLPHVRGGLPISAESDSGDVTVETDATVESEYNFDSSAPDDTAGADRGAIGATDETRDPFQIDEEALSDLERRAEDAQPRWTAEQQQQQWSG